MAERCFDCGEKTDDWVEELRPFDPEKMEPPYRSITKVKVHANRRECQEIQQRKRQERTVAQQTTAQRALDKLTDEEKQALQEHFQSTE